MTISVLLAAQILFAHWVSDFVLQTHWMATNKSKNWLALTAHATVYTVSFCLVVLLLSAFVAMTESGEVRHAIFVLAPSAFAVWIALNGALHFVTDAITSRITSYFWTKGDAHNFFVVIGLDQMIHYFCLFGTLILLIG
jgi:hypothetical protein